MNFSLFNNHESRTPIKSITIEELGNMIRDNPHAAAIQERLAKETDEKKRRAIKGELQVVSMSCQLTTRNAAFNYEKRGVVPSELMQVDLDHIPVDEIPAVTQKLQQMRGCLITFISPSGTGIKAGFWVEGAGKPKNEHAHAWKFVADRVAQATGYRPDAAPKSPFSLCYVAYSSEVWTQEVDESFECALNPGPCPPEPVRDPMMAAFDCAETKELLELVVDNAENVVADFHNDKMFGIIAQNVGAVCGYNPEAVEMLDSIWSHAATYETYAETVEDVLERVCLSDPTPSPGALKNILIDAGVLTAGSGESAAEAFDMTPSELIDPSAAFAIELDEIRESMVRFEVNMWLQHFKARSIKDNESFKGEHFQQYLAPLVARLGSDEQMLVDLGCNKEEAIKLIRRCEVKGKIHGPKQAWIYNKVVLSKMPELFYDTEMLNSALIKGELYGLPFAYSRDGTKYYTEKPCGWQGTKDSVIWRDLCYAVPEVTEKFAKALAASMAAHARESLVIDRFYEIAGRKRGVINCGPRTKALVPQGVTLRAGRNETCPVTLKFIDELLGEEAAVYFHGWLQRSLSMLWDQEFLQGQVLAFIGKGNAGKSTLQDLITRVLNGGAADAAAWVLKGSDFNGGLGAAVHLQVDDAAPGRGAFKMGSPEDIESKIKKIATNSSHLINPKGVGEFNMPVLWRCTMSLNDTPETREVLPPANSGGNDKLMLFACNPKQTDLEGRGAFPKVLDQELEGYVHWLRKVFSLPEALKDDRYGVKAWRDPEEELEQLSNSPIGDLAQILAGMEDSMEDVSSGILFEKLMSDTHGGLKRVARNSIALGKRISTLAHDTPLLERFRLEISSRVLHGYKLWSILNECSETDEDILADFEL